MGYSIIVETDKLRQMANAIGEYRRHQGNSMHELGKTVGTLRQNEIGAEFDLFQQKWSAIQGADSTAAKMLSCLLNYEHYLKYAAELYEIVQSNAAYRANSA